MLMKNDILLDAISNIDDDIVEKHILMRNKLSQSKSKKTNRYIKWLATAAVLAIVASCIPLLHILQKDGQRYESEAVGENESDYITYTSYKPLEYTIGEEILYGNIDMATVDEDTLRFTLWHEEGNKSKARIVECVYSLKEHTDSEIRIVCYFPTYDGKIGSLPQEKLEVSIGGTEVEYYDYTEGYSEGFLSGRYHMRAIFTYDECTYVADVYAKEDVEIFFQVLEDLLTK